jgi:hypothetical protein
MVVLGTNFGILMFLITGSGVGPVASIVRMFRIGRLIRLINSARELRKLFNTLITSLPSMANIGFLLAILFFIFSVMGVQAYGKIHLEAGDGDLTVHANFHSMPESFLVLFRFSTGENWNGFMHSIMDDLDGCVEEHEDVVWNTASDNVIDRIPFCVAEKDYLLEPLEGCTVEVDGVEVCPPCRPIPGCGSGAAISPILFFYS